MHRSVVRRAVSAIAAVSAAVAALGWLAAPAQAAVGSDAAPNQVELARAAGLYGDGAAIVVKVDARCAVGVQDAFLFVRVSQVDEEFGTVSGDGFAAVACTGMSERVPVAVPGYAAFGTGVAFASAELQVCDEFSCTTAEHSREIIVAPGTREVRSFSSDDLSYRLPRTSEIRAGGAGAVVLVSYTCAAGLVGDFDALLAQATAGGFTNTSTDRAELRCTASSRTGVLAFHANGRGWQPGDAFLLVNGYACDPVSDPCTRGTTYRTTRLA